MFNPFKWHIIKYRERFIIRKLTLLGFRYLDRDDGDAWSGLHNGWVFGGFITKTDAQMLLSTLKVERV